MAVLRKVTGGIQKKEAPVAVSSTKLSLPSSVSVPSDRLQDYSMLIYGEKKIGKTSLSSKFEKTFFLMLEPGAKALSVYQRPVKSWSDFKQYVELLQEDESFDTIVVDPVDIAYNLCVQYICTKHVISHPSDEEWGKAWQAIKDEFTTIINKLLRLNKGVILISHATEKEIKSRSGEKFHKIGPTMSGQARDILEGIVDIWAYYCYENNKRTLVIEGDELVGAGHRLEKRFKYTNGKPVHTISMGKSATEAHANFMAAFNNQLKEEGSTIVKPVQTVIKRKVR